MSEIWAVSIFVVALVFLAGFSPMVQGAVVQAWENRVEREVNRRISAALEMQGRTHQSQVEEIYRSAYATAQDRLTREIEEQILTEYLADSTAFDAKARQQLYEEAKEHGKQEGYHTGWNEACNRLTATLTGMIQDERLF